MLMRAATVVQVLQDLFYVLLYVSVTDRQTDRETETFAALVTTP